MTLAAYDAGRDVLTRTSSRTEVGGWYGGGSGQMPGILASMLCG